jgi:hypothetical protein
VIGSARDIPLHILLDGSGAGVSHTGTAQIGPKVYRTTPVTSLTSYPDEFGEAGTTTNAVWRSSCWCTGRMFQQCVRSMLCSEQL